MPELCSSIALRRGGHVTVAVDTPADHAPGRTPVVVLGHGAGNDMRSEFMEFFAAALSDRGLAAVRFNFPYKEVAGKRPPNPMPVLADTYVDVVAASARTTGSPPGPLFVGGKSMGGRVATVACAEGRIRPTGLVLLGYPLHPAGRPDDLRTSHLGAVRRPMLFVQGDRDPLCGLERLRAERKRLRLPGALHVVPGGDHSFALPAAARARQRAELDRAADAIAAFVRRVLEGPGPG